MGSALRFLLAAAPWFGPVVIIRTGAFADSGVALFLGCLGAHVVGSYALLYLLRRPAQTAAQGKLIFMRLLVGAPLAVWLLASIVGLIGGNDLALDGVYLFGLPALMVWPAILLALRGVRDPSGTDPNGNVLTMAQSTGANGFSGLSGEAKPAS